MEVCAEDVRGGVHGEEEGEARDDVGEQRLRKRPIPPRSPAGGGGARERPERVEAGGGERREAGPLGARGERDADAGGADARGPRARERRVRVGGGARDGRLDGPRSASSGTAGAIGVPIFSQVCAPS